ncbi:alpha/beta hydrolase [Romboutsia sp.]|uniref:alpha/beta hydrolase n=1 Tax=Romboutsia sp. TaxID=1965302 RepID=UPI003F33A43A
MNSNNYRELVEALEKNIEVKTTNNGDIIIKKIPDTDLSGCLDPRVLNVLMNMDKYSFKDERVDDTFMFNGFPLGQMRASMGWNNEDITTTEIKTTYKNIQGEESEIPVRIYTPENISKNAPCLIFFHGGGFIGGSVDTVENPCKALAEKGDMVVVSVDYRLAPENPYPAQVVDCFDIVKWVYKNGEELNVDINKIGVSGDSAGGNLAAVCAMKDRDLKTNMIKYQALIYPVVTLSNKECKDYNWSIDEYERDVHKELIEKMVTAMQGAEDLLTMLYLQNPTLSEDAYASPLLVEDLSGLPKTLMVVAEYDFLRIQGECYAKRLKEAGVDCRSIRYNGMDHAFIDKTGLYPQAEDCINEIAKDMKLNV